MAHNNKNLDDAINDLLERREHERKKDEQTRKEHQKAERQRREKENALTPQKQLLLDEILAWRDEFIAQPKHKKALKEIGTLDIYGGKWGHQPDGGYGAWSRVQLHDDGTLKYWAGYKYFPTGPTIDLEEKKALTITHDYITKLHQHITSGKVYEKITKELNERR